MSSIGTEGVTLDLTGNCKAFKLKRGESGTKRCDACEHCPNLSSASYGQPYFTACAKYVALAPSP